MDSIKEKNTKENEDLIEPELRKKFKSSASPPQRGDIPKTKRELHEEKCKQLFNYYRLGG